MVVCIVMWCVCVCCCWWKFLIENSCSSLTGALPHNICHTTLVTPHHTAPHHTCHHACHTSLHHAVSQLSPSTQHQPPHTPPHPTCHQVPSTIPQCTTLRCSTTHFTSLHYPTIQYTSPALPVHCCVTSKDARGDGDNGSGGGGKRSGVTPWPAAGENLPPCRINRFVFLPAQPCPNTLPCPTTLLTWPLPPCLPVHHCYRYLSTPATTTTLLPPRSDNQPSYLPPFLPDNLNQPPLHGVLVYLPPYTCLHVPHKQPTSLLHRIPASSPP